MTDTHNTGGRRGRATVYGVTIQTVGRRDGDGVTMVFVESCDPSAAESQAAAIARQRYGCEVLADHAVECPGFAPTLRLERS